MKQIKSVALTMTHDPLGRGLVEIARLVLGDDARVDLLPIDVTPDEPPEAAAKRATRLLADAGLSEAPLLVLTDLYGSTPFNAAVRLAASHGGPCRVVSGLNVPMVLLAAQHASTTAVEPLARGCVRRARRGIVMLED